MFALAALLALASASHAASAPRSLRPLNLPRGSVSSPSGPPVGLPDPSKVCTVQWFNQTLDHFSPVPGPNGQTTYLQRYFVCDVNAGQPRVRAPGACQPALVYTGNEADVQLYVNESYALLFRAAQELDATVVFMEHRYFGQSQPFGSNFPTDPAHMRFLSSEQALADYATLLFYLRSQVWKCDAPAVAFGGSYGGMLASWFRIKYPSAVDGAIACSAPIWAFPGETPPVDPEYFARGETYDAEVLGSPSCANNIRQAWQALFRLSNSAQGLAQASAALRLCSPMQSADDALAVANWAAGGFSFLAMGSYPYPSSYMLNGNGVLPPFPMQVVCSSINNTNGYGSDLKLLSAFADSIGVWFNYTQSLTCYPWNEAAPNNETALDGLLWDYLACSEMVMPAAQDGSSDMFWSAPWSFDLYAQGCQQRWGITPNQYWIEAYYGGRDIASVTNLVFSQGELDPWLGGGPSINLTSSIVSYVIQDAGHHMDLMAPNPADTPSVLFVRDAEIGHVKAFIAEGFARRGTGPASHAQQL